MKTDQAFAIRSFAVEDIPQALRLSADLGWPQRLEDWQFLCEVGQGVVACDDRGHVVGSALWFAFGDDVAAVGMIIVSAAVQRRGIARALMETVSNEAGDRELRLNSTIEGHRLYQSLGFEPVGTIVQHQGIANCSQRPSKLENGHVRAARTEDWGALVALDAAAHGARREGLFAALKRCATGTVCERDGERVGFALSRRSGRGHVIGPIIAESDAIAISLVEPHMRTLESNFVRVDVPLEAGRFRDHLDDIGLKPVDHVMAMERGRRSNRKGSGRILGLVNQALG